MTSVSVCSGVPGCKMLLLDEEPGLDRRERVADFVGDAGGQHAERGELFVAFDQRLAFDQLDPQRRNQLAIDHHGQPAAGEQQQGQRSQQHHAQVGERSSSNRPGTNPSNRDGLWPIGSRGSGCAATAFRNRQTRARRRCAGRWSGAWFRSRGGRHVIVVPGVDEIEQPPLSCPVKRFGRSVINPVIQLRCSRSESAPSRLVSLIDAVAEDERC